MEMVVEALSVGRFFFSSRSRDTRLVSDWSSGVCSSDLQRLMAQALAGRAEIRILRGEPGLAILEAERALAMHRELQDAVRETEDLRILAVAVGVEIGRGVV